MGLNMIQDDIYITLLVPSSKKKCLHSNKPCRAFTQRPGKGGKMPCRSRFDSLVSARSQKKKNIYIYIYIYIQLGISMHK